MYRLRTFGGFSIERDGATLDRMRVHRKAHALLAVLAAQGSAGREPLMALLWPESGSGRAKGSLKQAIHLLRRQLDAPDLLLGTAELRLNPERIESDVALFLRALADGDAATAVRLYRGPFLDGVYLDRTSEFERWVDMQRGELARQYMSALEQLAEGAEADGDHTTAAGLWRRLQSADPLNGRVAVKLMLALEASGDRAAALQHARVHETLLLEEWGITADPSVAALAERLRTSSRATPPRSLADSAPQQTPASDSTVAAQKRGPPVPGPARPATNRWLRHPRAWRIAPAWPVAAAVLLAGVYTLATVSGREAIPGPILAVGRFEPHGDGAPSDNAAAAADMLATNLARVPGLQVVSSARMYEILAQLGDTTTRQAATADAARRAGAGELIEGSLYETPAGGLRLDLRRVDLRTGAVRNAHIVDGGDIFQVVDRATVELASGFGLTAADLRLAEITTTSLVAYRFYEEGLRSFAVADYRTAHRLFEAAVAEDSLFAMALHYLSATTLALHEPLPDSTRERLLRLAERAGDRERLLIRASWGPAQRRLAQAETLAVRYPAEPDGHLLLGLNLVFAGDFFGALPHLQRVIRLDSLGLRGSRPRCLACDALGGMMMAYTNADSLAAAERVAREWAQHQPRSASAWAHLAWVLELQGRPDEALAARRKAASLNAIDHNDAIAPAWVRIRTGDFATADRLLRDVAREGTAELRREALWWLTISLRYQGRLHEALATIRQLSREFSSREAFPVLLHEGQVLFEQRRVADAAIRFQSAAELVPAGQDQFGMKSWAGTHRATAFAAVGDTTRLAQLADTIEAWGRQSPLGRDWRLHHHVRGLLLAQRGQPESAIAEFRRAVWSPTTGYTRTNLELARLLLAADRSQEAVSILQPALRGGFESSNLYVTHTELHELLGHAWAAAGRPDSAAVHYHWVLEAWRQADPELHARRDTVRARLAAMRTCATRRCA